ncbi:hypothetical protein PAMA_001851 [Pampus argenteus]
MWKRGGRSSALDRAQALLSGKRTTGGDAEVTQPSTADTPTQKVVVGGYFKDRPAPPNTHTLLSDLSDLSSVSSASERGAAVVGSAHAPIKDPRPQSSLGGGSRFLKKVPPPATNSKSQIQVPEHRYVSSSQRGSQTAALSRLAQIENRIRSRKEAQEQAQAWSKPAHNLSSDTGISPPPVSLEPPPVLLSAQSNSEESQKGKRFLKNKASVAVDGSDTAAAAAESLKGPDVGVRSMSRAADVPVPSVGLERKSLRIVNSVSLESDEEDMRKLLRDSLDSTDNSLLRAERPSSRRTTDKMLNRSSQRVRTTPPPSFPPPPPAVHTSSPPNTARSRSPASPPCRTSPFRFTGQAQDRFSPSVLSPSPPPPHRAESPRRSFSSMSHHEEVLSLEELFPVGPGSEDHSEMSLASTEDFKINVMTLDDLVPASLGFTEETPAKEDETKHSLPAPGSPNRHQQLPGLNELGEERRQQEDEADYQSDFESESRMEPDYSASQVSEHLLGDGEEEEALDSDVSSGRTEDNYSGTFSDTSRSYTSQTSDRSQRSLSGSRSSVSRSDGESARPSRRRASTRKVFKEAAVQTQPDPLAYTWSSGIGPAVGMTYMNPTPVTTHAVSSDTVEALSTFNPAVYVLNQMLKQHLAMASRFIESSRHLYSTQLRSLEPPNYRYITLEDTKEYIRKHTPPKLTMEEALKETLQEMKDYHST